MPFPGSFWPSSFWPGSFWSGSSSAEAPSSGITYALYINGTERHAALSSFRINMVLNGVDDGVATIISEDGSPAVRFDVYDEVVLTQNGTRRWAGYVTNVDEDGEGGPATGRFTQRLTLAGYASILNRRHLDFSPSLGSPGSPGAALTDVLSALIAQGDPSWADDGITLHPSQSTGPVLKDMVFEDALGTEILNRIATDNGLVWRVDEFQRLRMWAKGDNPAPFDIDEDDLPQKWFGDVRTTKTFAQGYANRVIVKGQTQTIFDYGETVTHNGSQTSFNTSVTMLGTRQSAIGSTGPLTSLGIADGDTLWEGLGPEGSTSVWRYSIDPVTRIGTFTRPGGALPSGTTTRLVFDAEVKPRGVANDLVEQALPNTPVIDLIVNAPVTTDADAQDLAETILPFLVAAKEIKAKYTTFNPLALTPGMDQSIGAPTRDLTGSPAARFLLQRVSLYVHPQGPATSSDTDWGLVQEVDMTLGEIPRGDWRDLIALFTSGASPSNISNGNNGGSGNTGGSTVITNPGGDTNEGGSGTNIAIPPDHTDVFFNRHGAIGTARANDISHIQVIDERPGEIAAGGSPGSANMIQMRLTTLGDTQQPDSLQVWTTPNAEGMLAVGNIDDDTTELLMGLELVEGDYMVRHANPAYVFEESSFAGMGAIGMEMIVNETIGQPAVFDEKRGFAIYGNGAFEVYQEGMASGAVTGCSLWLERNTAGNGAASTVRLQDRDGGWWHLWVEDGKLRIGGTFGPTEDDSVSHTSGAVVGSQS